MSQIRKVLGTSFISLFLVIWGLFMVCSGRVPSVNLDDDFASIEDDYGDGERSDLVEQLALLDEESTDLDDPQRAEILEALGVDPSPDVNRRPEEDFLTEELFLDLEVEIAELEKLSRRRSEMIDSLNLELQEADYRIAALQNVVGDAPTSQLASSRGTFAPQLRFTNGTRTEYELSYQNALNDVYGHNYQQAIAKFQDLLKLNSGSDLADNCQYWIGECYYALKNYEMALAEFEKVFALENNNKADDAQFMIGMCYLRIGDRGLAEVELNNLLTFYDNSEYVGRAERQLLDLNI